MNYKDKKFIEIQVSANDSRYKTLPTEGYLVRKTWREPNPKEVRSIIPGSVTSIEVKVGDRVRKGSPLMEYEAMKMQNIVVAPVDGTVRKINVKSGDKLPKDHILLELD